MDFETRAIHDGQEPDPATGAIITPIYQTSTYVQDAVGEHKGYDYSRVANPTRTALETALASLESAEHGIAFSSGLGATTTLMHLVEPGRARRAHRRRLRRRLPDDVAGLRAEGLPLRLPAGGGVRRTSPTHLDDSTRMVWVETPSNPMLNVVDIRRRRRGRARGRRAPRRRQHVRDAVPAAAARARRRRRRPLDDEVPRRPLRRGRRLRGDERPDRWPSGSLPAEVARRGARAVRLLARAARDQDARAADAAALRERDGDRRGARAALARRAGLLSGPARRTPATRSRRARCATSAAWSRSSPSRRRRPRRSSARTQLFQLAESLGGVESLIEVPARMTHASTADAPFAAPPNLVRLSVGIESAEDLVDDLENALVPAAARA